jgi:ATP-dependent protease ClpP protease subunit
VYDEDTGILSVNMKRRVVYQERFERDKAEETIASIAKFIQEDPDQPVFIELAGSPGGEVRALTKLPLIYKRVSRRHKKFHTYLFYRR